MPLLKFFTMASPHNSGKNPPTPVELVERSLIEVLDAYTPVALDYSCTVPRIEMAGFSLPQNGARGGDLAFPVMFLAPEERESQAYSLHPDDVRSQAVVHALKKGPSRLGLFLADATGHRLVDGVLASMLYHAARVGVHYELRIHDDVGSTLAQTLNDVFYRGTPSALPISLLLARFQPDIHKEGVNGSYISAGNPHPCILRAGSQSFEFFDISRVHCSAPIGVMPTCLEDSANAYRPNRFHLAQGDTLLLYSDGFGDLGKNHQKTYFPGKRGKGRDWALDLLLRNRQESAQDIARAFYNDILSYTLHREDDITLYVVKSI